MKSIEQLLELSANQYYTFSPEEKKELDAFLAKQSEQQSQAKKNGKDSEKNIPATVLNKNVVRKNVGEIPVINNVVAIKNAEVPEISDDVDVEVDAFEDIVHPDAVK
jgi:hypothetical protein